MKKCPLCGSELPAHARFCGICGSEQPPATAEDEETQPFRPISPNLLATPPLAPSQAPLSRRTARKGIIIALTTIIILAAVAAGIVTYILTQLQPAISVTSNYRLGSALAGSPGTVFHISGQKFSSSSPITFLLDGRPLPAEQGVHSDTNGNIQADLTITNSWTLGRHILNVRDARGITPRSGVAVTIVPQGQANTPGPRGAPPDDLSFRVNVSVQSHDAVTGQKFNLFTETLIVTGRPDPVGGTVCSPFDDGKAHTLNGNSLNQGVTVRETVVLTCSGTYKSGKLSFTETATSYAIDFSNGVSCLVKTPYIYNQLQGTFTGQNGFSGVYSAGTPALTCQQGFTGIGHAAKGTWSGQVATT